MAVDTESGFVVATEMIANTDEKSVVAGALDTIKEDFNEVPKRVLADGIYGHGTLLEELDERKIDFYSPGKDLSNNPAIRDDPRQAVPEEQWDRLPYERKRKRRQLSKDAFIYDAEEDVYYCPQGQPLNYTSTTRSVVGGQESERRRYRSSEVVCAGCPLRQQCILSENRHVPLRRRRLERQQPVDRPLDYGLHELGDSARNVTSQIARAREHAVAARTLRTEREMIVILLPPCLERPACGRFRRKGRCRCCRRTRRTWRRRRTRCRR